MKTRASRPGYSLFELVLVLAVLLIASALSLPSLKVMYGSYKRDGAVDAVRAAWAQARARAIEEGRPYRFGVVPDGGHYRVAPDTPDYWSGSGHPTDGTGKPGKVVEGSLPPGVRFSVNAPTGQGGSDPVSDWPDTSGKGPKGAVPAESYSNAAVFLPDGTAKADCEILFQVRGTSPVSLKLRGMTGAVTVKNNVGGR
jgi:type II secretory pathway pseudopilin PulG